MNLIKSVDILGQPLALKFEGSTSVKTVVGAIASLVYFTLVISAVVMASLEYTDKSNPTVLQYQTHNNNESRIDMNADMNVFPIIYLLRDQKTPVRSSEVLKYVTPMVIKRKIVADTTSLDSIGISVVDIEMPLLPCEDLMNDSGKYKYYKQYEFSSLFTKFALKGFGLCVAVNETEAYTKGSDTGIEQEKILIHMLPCSLQKGCANYTEISRVSIVTADNTVSLNFADYNDPLRMSINVAKQYFLNPGLQHFFKYHLTINEIKEDRSKLYSYTEISKFLSNNYVNHYEKIRYPNQLNCTKKDIESHRCPLYFEVSYTSSESKYVSVRSYTTLRKALSEIGGIASFMYFIIFYILQFFMRKSTQSAIASTIFSNSLLKSVKPRPKGKTSIDTEQEAPCDLGLAGVQMVDSFLDVSNLVRELCVLKSLAESLFRERHSRLAPYMILAKQCGKADRYWLNMAMRSHESEFVKMSA